MSDDWRPIETAPRDGKPVLLWERYSTSPLVGFWGERSGKWIADAEHVDADGDACVVDHLCQELITHWMPLPLPPIRNPKGCGVKLSEDGWEVCGGTLQGHSTTYCSNCGRQ